MDRKKNAAKLIRNILLTLFLILALLIIFSFIFHKIRLSMEKEKFVPIGRRVEVNGHCLNVCSEGEGKTTLVFMSGAGTCSPLLDFKSLCSELSDEYKIAVVEKAGYGFSDDSDISRDIDTMLFETRAALRLSGHTPPYVLVPHSMSGIEALYWAQQYPEEISAIIGLDMSVPEFYKEMKISVPFVRLLSLASDIGLTRLIPGISESEAIKHGALTEEEKELYRIIFYRRTLTTAMINELKEVKNNAKKVSEGDPADVPILLFSSNGDGTGFDKDTWRRIHNNFISAFPEGKIIEVDLPHYLHDYDYKGISEEIKIYLSDIIK